MNSNNTNHQHNAYLSLSCMYKSSKIKMVNFVTYSH